MTKPLPVPEDLQHLIEKRERDRRQAESEQDPTQQESDAGQAEGQKTNDPPRFERRSDTNRRKS
jgi:hypothetical protein